MPSSRGRERTSKKISGKNKAVQGNPNLALNVLRGEVRKKIYEIIINSSLNEIGKSDLLEKIKQEFKKKGLLSKTEENAITTLQKEISRRKRRK